MKPVNCPGCGTKGCAAVTAIPRFGRVPAETIITGPCAACGWCRHTTEICDYTAATGLCERCNRPAVERREWCEVDHLPRGTTPEEEWRFRASMFVVWKTQPASALRQHLEVFADWLRERESAEEVAARADWKPYANKKSDPKGWWQWTVPAGAGWVLIEETRAFREARWTRDGDYTPGGYKRVRYINDDRAKLTKSMHNGRWLLCWPPGFVRITGPLHHDASRWRVTVQPGRIEGKSSSRPVERVWPGGYSQLLAPYEAPRLNVVDGVVRPEGEENLGLFAEDAA